MKERNTFLKFIKGFSYAFQGLAYAVKTQRNLRIHITVSAFMFFFLLRYDFFEISKSQFAILALTCGLVIALELLNTALESVVDLVSPEYSRLAKIAKDTAAGAVLVCAVAAVAVGLILMLQPRAFAEMAAFYKTHLPELAAVLICIAVALVWIFMPSKKQK